MRVEGYSMIGELVESPAGGKALVQLGPLKMTIPLAKMSLVEEPQAKERSRALSMRRAARHARMLTTRARERRGA